MFKGPTKYSEYIQDVPKSIDYILKRVNAVTVADLQAVTNAGATTTLPINTGGITSDYFQLDTAATPTLAPGVFGWDDAYGTADLRLKGNNVTLQLGQEILARVVNKTGSDLLESQYKVVRVRIASEGGAQGQRLAVVLAQGNNDPDSVTTLGIVTETILNNEEGFITILGNVNNIDTTGTLQGETWVDGDVLYLSPTTPGSLTKVKPVAPNHTVTMGYVVYAHNNQGKIFVKVDNGYELDELHNVLITSPANNDLLQYDSAQQVWKNVAPSIAVPTPTLAQVTTAGNTTTNAITVGGLTSTSNGLIASSSGNINTVPLGVLHVRGENGGSGAAWGGITLSSRGSSNGVYRLRLNGNDTTGAGEIGVPYGNPLILQGGGTYFGNAAESGNVLIGTTTDAGYKLDVNGNTAVRGSLLVTDTSGTLRTAISGFDSNEIAFRGTRWAPDAGTLTYSGGQLTLSGSNRTLAGNQDIIITNVNGNVPNAYITLNGQGASVVYSNRTRDIVLVTMSTTIPSGSSNISYNSLNISPNVNYAGVTGSSNFRGLYYNPILTGFVGEHEAIRTTSGKVIHQGLTNATHTDQVYYNTTTGELTYGALPTPATPTLDQVTTAGNTTTNSATLGGLTVNTTANAGGIVLQQNGTLIAELRRVGNNNRSALYLWNNNTLEIELQTGGFSYFRSNSLAIGTPIDAGYKLDVNGSTRIKGTGTTDSTIALLVQNNTGRLLLQSDDGGFTRIGGPTARLYVGVESGGAAARLVVNGEGLFSNGGIGNAGGFYIDQGGTSSASRTIWYDGSGTPKNLITGNGDNYITSGNFGIGTTSPIYNLEVSSVGYTGFGIMSGANSNAEINFQNRGYGLPRWTIRATGAPDGSSGGLYFQRLASSFDLTIESTGNVLIGTTTDAGYKLDVVGADSRFNGVRVGVGAGGVGSNTVVGNGALNANTSGYENTAIGYQSSYSLTGGLSNTAVGYQSLYLSTVGEANTAIGWYALRANTSDYITAVGYQALKSNTFGQSNTAVGANALEANTGGQNNTSVGWFSLQSNTTGSQNTALGSAALNVNSTGISNTAVGYIALEIVSTGNQNTAIGVQAGKSITTASNNTIVGSSALRNSTGSDNTAIGYQAGYYGVANTTGTNNIFIGNLSTGVSATESNRTWIGNSSTTSTWLAGNVLIGTTTDNGNKLNVNGDVSAQAYKVNNVLGFTGIFNVPTNPPGQQNIDIQGGIVINIF